MNEEEKENLRKNTLLNILAAIRSINLSSYERDSIIKMAMGSTIVKVEIV